MASVLATYRSARLFGLLWSRRDMTPDVESQERNKDHVKTEVEDNGCHLLEHQHDADQDDGDDRHHADREDTL